MIFRIFSLKSSRAIGSRIRTGEEEEEEEGMMEEEDRDKDDFVLKDDSAVHIANTRQQHTNKKLLL